MFTVIQINLLYVERLRYKLRSFTEQNMLVKYGLTQANILDQNLCNNLRKCLKYSVLKRCVVSSFRCFPNMPFTERINLYIGTNRRQSVHPISHESQDKSKINSDTRHDVCRRCHSDSAQSIVSLIFDGSVCQCIYEIRTHYQPQKYKRPSTRYNMSPSTTTN